MWQRRVENPRYTSYHALLRLHNLDLPRHNVLISSFLVLLKLAILAHFQLDLPRSQFANGGRPRTDLCSLLSHWPCGGSLRPIVLGMGVTDGRHFASLLRNLLLCTIQVLCLSIYHVSIIIHIKPARLVWIPSLCAYITNTVLAQGALLFLEQVAIALIFSLAFSGSLLLFSVKFIRSCVQWLPSHLRLTFIERWFVDLVVAQVSVLLWTSLAMVLVVKGGIGCLLPSDDIGLDLFLNLLILTALRKLIVQVVGLIHIDQVVRSLNHMWRRVVLAVH